MIRTFNYTKRKKIPSDRVLIELKRVEWETFFTTTLNLDDLNFPKDAKVFIEAYYGPTVIRFDFGTIKNIVPPKNTDITQLTKISDKVLFRLKVVDENKGLILGYANIFLAEDNCKSHVAILYVNAVLMDTHEVWRLNFNVDSEGTPALEVNNAIEGIRDIARSDEKFMALVYPHAVRGILSRIANEGHFEKDGDTWMAKWINFTEDILGVRSTPRNNKDEAVIHEWFDEVVRSFILKNNLFNLYIKSLK